MAASFDPSNTFHAMLRSSTEASTFYAACTPAQQAAIEHQAARLESRTQVKGFVEHLPSAAL